VNIERNKNPDNKEKRKRKTMSFEFILPRNTVSGKKTKKTANE